MDGKFTKNIMIQKVQRKKKPRRIDYYEDSFMWIKRTIKFLFKIY